MQRIGAKDTIDMALVKQYANVKTCNFDEQKISPEDMWEKINLLAITEKNYINLKQNLKIAS